MYTKRIYWNFLGKFHPTKLKCKFCIHHIPKDLMDNVVQYWFMHSIERTVLSIKMPFSPQFGGIDSKPFSAENSHLKDKRLQFSCFTLMRFRFSDVKENLCFYLYGKSIVWRISICISYDDNNNIPKRCIKFWPIYS